MHPQRLRHRITLEAPATVQDDWDGDTAIEFAPTSDSTDLPAEVLTGPGREAITGGAKYADAAARINIRYFPGLDESWRVVWNGVTYGILAISTDVTGVREHRLVCGTLGDGL